MARDVQHSDRHLLQPASSQLEVETCYEDTRADMSLLLCHPQNKELGTVTDNLHSPTNSMILHIHDTVWILLVQSRREVVVREDPVKVHVEHPVLSAGPKRIPQNGQEIIFNISRQKIPLIKVHDNGIFLSWNMKFLVVVILKTKVITCMKIVQTLPLTHFLIRTA